MIFIMTESEQAVLKTIIYSDIFEYALKKEEIFNYLIGKRLSLNNIDKILNFLIRKKIVVEEKGYYYLKQEKSLAQLRQKRADISRKKIIKAQKWARFLKLNPYLKMVAITGTLAVENADVGDDIDLMLVFSKNRLFLGRIIEYVVLKLIGKRRNPQQKEAQDLLCPNLYLSEENIHIEDQNLFIAHEIVQMKLLWDRGGTYKLFIEKNLWTNNFLPNWQKKFEVNSGNSGERKIKNGFIIFDLLEKIAKNMQLKYMRKKISSEKISDKALYFHPHDVKKEIMENYQHKLTQFG